MTSLSTITTHSRLYTTIHQYELRKEGRKGGTYSLGFDGSFPSYSHRTSWDTQFLVLPQQSSFLVPLELLQLFLEPGSPSRKFVLSE